MHNLNQKGKHNNVINIEDIIKYILKKGIIMSKGTIVYKIYSYLKKVKKVSLKELYMVFPEHSAASIRGNLNRYISKNGEKIKRIGKGLYSLNNAISFSKEKTNKIKNKRKTYKVYKGDKSKVFNDLLITLGKVVGQESLFSFIDNGVEEEKPTEEHSNYPYLTNNKNEEDKYKHLSLVGATRKDKGKNREVNDFYPTPSYAVKDILDRENLIGDIYEPACGDGAISEVLKKYYPSAKIVSSDLIDRGYGEVGVDFLKDTLVEEVDNVITNPPFKIAKDFILKALKIAKKKVIMLLKIQALESVERYLSIFKDNCLKKVYVYVKRLSMYKGGIKGENTSTMCFAWFVWEKEYKGSPMIDWIY